MSLLSPKELKNLKTLILSADPNNWELATQILLAQKETPIKDHFFLSFLMGIIIFRTDKMQPRELQYIKNHLLFLIELGDKDFYKKVKHLPADFRVFNSKFGRHPNRLYHKLSALIDNSPVDQKIFLTLPFEQQGANFVYSWQCRFLLERGLLSLEEFEKLFIKKDKQSKKNSFTLIRIPIQKVPEKYLEHLLNQEISHLTLSSNQLTELPTIFYQLKKLEYLSINQNPIQKIEASSETWPKLTNLEIYRCKQLQELPNTLIETAPLRKLSISSCQLKLFPSIVLKAKKLLYLSLAGNKFTAVPCAITELKQLKTLNLNNNINLKKLPETLGQLGQLQGLKLSNCALIDLPSSLGDLKNLNDIRLGNNRLQELPDRFFELDNIQEISLSNNLISLTKEFLDRLLALPNLSNLGLDNMPITPKIYKEYYESILKPRFWQIHITNPQR